MKAIIVLLQKLIQGSSLFLAVLLSFVPFITTRISQISDWLRAHTGDIGFHLAVATVAHMIADAVYAIIHIIMQFLH